MRQLVQPSRPREWSLQVPNMVPDHGPTGDLIVFTASNGIRFFTRAHHLGIVLQAHRLCILSVSSTLPDTHRAACDHGLQILRGIPRMGIRTPHELRMKHATAGFGFFPRHPALFHAPRDAQPCEFSLANAHRGGVVSKLLPVGSARICKLCVCRNRYLHGLEA